MVDKFDTSELEIYPAITLDDFLEMEIEAEDKLFGQNGQASPRKSDLEVAQSRLKLYGNDKAARELLDQRVKFIESAMKMINKKDAIEIGKTLIAYKLLQEDLNSQEEI